ncbi:MAG: hypothetical protein QOG80_2521 [Pseudonocardiales bacterium]|nr:hypothetical protein [Pseudonocardiales bacterium]
MDEHDDLTTSLLDLANLVAYAVPLEQVLLRLAMYPVQLIPSAEGAVLTLLDGAGSGLTVASDPLVRSADEAHAVAGEGPALKAMADCEVVTSASLGGDPSFPRFGSQVARLGLHSVIAAPLTLVDRAVIGVLTVYSRAKHAFNAYDSVVLVNYARPAAAVTRNAQVLTRSQLQIAQLNEALRIRPVIDQAIGIIRHRTGKSEREAFERLREISNVKHVKVSDVAAELVNEAVRNAQLRRRHDM